MKINNICDNANLKKCGFSDKIRRFGHGASKIATPKTIKDLNTYFNGSFTNVKYYQIVTNNAAFETVNGESIIVSYNPNCSYFYGVNIKDGSQNLM